MFCHKCGTQIKEGSRFCQKCGTPVVYENMQSDTQIAAETVQSKSIQEDKPPKGKNKRLWIILGIVVLLVVIAIAANSGSDDIDYIATVQNHQPFAVSQNIPYTFDEVFSKYVDGF